MRLTQFVVENYRGIEYLSSGPIDHHPYILLTGKNGTGKSLVLEALAAVWAGEINLPDLVGPYATSLAIELAISLTPEEYDLLDGWMYENGQNPVERKDEHVLKAVATSIQDSGRYVERDEVLESLQNTHFADKFSFANFNLLSARRQPTLGTHIDVDLDLLDSRQNASQRRQMMQDEVRWNNAQYMPDVGSYLTALDYREYVAQRSGQEASLEYSRLQDAFFRATGKTISRPSFDPHTGRPEISVCLPTGVKHGLADLSNGEREMIGMFYYISQLSSRGGVLLLDEPEKHLHPTLQSAVLEAITSLAGQGQALIVSHSPTIVATVPEIQICSIRGAWESLDNQLIWASSSEHIVEPLTEIGVNPRDLLQMEALVIVEGPSDSARLRMLFPKEMAKVKVIDAGGRSRALRTADSLKGLNIGIPYLCVVDRDFLNDDEVESLEADGIFVWRSRMIENVLLDAALIARVTNKDQSHIQGLIDSCASDLSGDAIRTFAEQRVLRHPTFDSIEQTATTEDFIRHQIAVWNTRLRDRHLIESSTQDLISNAWDDSYKLYVDGKKLFRMLNTRLGVFRSPEVFIEMLLSTARADHSLMPCEFKRFSEELVQATSPSKVDEIVSSEKLSDLDDRVRAVLEESEPDSTLNSNEGADGRFFH